MADSDDEYDRKRRDKFRGERSGGGLGSRDDRSRRDDWPDRESWSSRSRRSEYRDYRGGPGLGGSRYSPARDPPSKRMRPDWGGGGGGGGGGLDDRRYGPPHDAYGSYGWVHDAYGHHAPHQAYPLHSHATSRETNAAAETTSDGVQPTMMSFKAFLSTQDDSITDEDAIKKYNDYKLEFRRQQLNEFFIAHKDEEWFKIKYHPEESLKRKEEQRSSLENRLRVFANLLDEGRVDEIPADVEHADRLIRLLDTVVIKLEGGTDEDLKILDEKSEPPPPVENDKAIEIVDDKVENIKKEKEDSDDEAKKADEKKDEKDDKDPNPESVDKDEDKNREVEEQPKEDAASEKKVFSSFGNGTKRKRSRNSGDSSSSSSGSSSSSSSDSDSSDSEAEDGSSRRNNVNKDSKPADENEDAEIKKRKSADDDNSNVENDREEKKEAAHKDPEPPKEKNREVSKKIEEPEKKETRVALHKTTSIFLRNLSPTITKAEVEAMCRRYGGFLRVALADPLPDRRWFRRGWVSFKRDVNIKDICWNLNNIRLKDCELGAIVNRDLSRRIRPVNGITHHKQVIRADARLAAKLCYHLDAKVGLWDTKVINTQSDTFNQFNLQSSNPVLHNITEYLIEEASAEEEELLGLNSSNENGEGATNADGSENTANVDTIERDPQLAKVLDRLILYLRIVHSLDYYNHCEYPYEDEMPNRCGIMHARGSSPSNKVGPNEISEYIRNFESKISSFLQELPTLDDDELVKLGTKDPQGEVEKFIQANTQELAKDKWLCPLSGKKFKGPDFIRKHIFNKHAEKVEEVKKEVEYFNNYLKDVKRPQLQEQPAPTGRRTETAQPPSYPPTNYHPPYGYPPPTYPGPYPPRHIRSYSRGRGPSSDYRPVIHYRDLDAPREPEDFI